MEIAVGITGIDGVKRRLGRMTSPWMRRKMNQTVGDVLVERTADHLDEAAGTRHKVADRLGATYSKFLECASGRVADAKPGQGVFPENATESGVTIAIKGTPGLSRAYHDLEIRPVRAKALTIPLSRISYSKRVADLRQSGHEVFRPRGKSILAEKKGDGGIRPLYALVKSVRIPRDPGLLPSDAQFAEWAGDAVADFIESAEAMGTL